MKNIVLLGAPGSGKGTVAKKLTEGFPYKIISTSLLLRKSNNEEVLALIGKGELVPDEIISSLVIEEIKKTSNYILDGFLRTSLQVDAIKEYDDELVYIYLDVSEYKLIKRIKNRRICPQCGRNYSLSYKDLLPKEGEICDSCNIKLVKRTDDDLEVFLKRYDTFLEKTLPVINLLRDKDNFYIITDDDVEDILNKIRKIINDQD